MRALHQCADQRLIILLDRRFGDLIFGARPAFAALVDQLTLHSVVTVEGPVVANEYVKMGGMEMLPETADERALVEEVARTKERHRVLHACMAELNATYREALYLLYFEEMSYAQTGVVMGKTVRQITNIAYRGKISLRGLLEREGIMDAQS